MGTATGTPPGDEAGDGGNVVPGMPGRSDTVGKYRVIHGTATTGSASTDMWAATLPSCAGNDFCTNAHTRRRPRRRSPILTSKDMSPMPELRLRINGADHEADVSPQVGLLDVLREHLWLTGTKK